jgi:hypothetical protein
LVWKSQGKLSLEIPTRKPKANIKIKLEEIEYEEKLKTVFTGELLLVLSCVLVAIDGVWSEE